MLLCPHSPHGLTLPQQDSGGSSATLALLILLKFSSLIHDCTSGGMRRSNGRSDGRSNGRSDGYTELPPHLKEASSIWEEFFICSVPTSGSLNTSYLQVNPRLTSASQSRGCFPVKPLSLWVRVSHLPCAGEISKALAVNDLTSKATLCPGLQFAFLFPISDGVQACCLA